MMRNCILTLLVFFFETQLFAQIVGPYNGVTYLSNLSGPCSAGALAVLGDNDFTTNGTYEIAYGSTFSGTWATGLGYTDGPGADMLCVSLHTEEGWNVSLRLSDGTVTAPQLVDMVTILDYVTWNMYNCAGASNPNWYYDRRVAEVDFANYTIPAGLTVIGADFTLVSDNAGYSDPVGILLLTSTTVSAPVIANNGPLCQGQTLQLTITNENADMVYSWSGPDGFTATLQNPSLVFGANAAGIYTCVVTDTVTGDVFNLTTTVAAHPQPDGTILASGLCTGSPVLFDFSPAIGQNITTYVWDFGQGIPNTANTQQNAVVFSTSGNQPVSVVLTNNFGCTAIIDTVITLLTQPVAAFTPSTIIGCDPLEVTFTNNSQHAVSYGWYYGSGLPVNVTDLSAQSHTFTASATVTLIAQNGGCSDTAQLQITVPDCGCTDPGALNYDPSATYNNGSCVYPIPTVVAPNVFTPDENGENDLFFLTTTNTAAVELIIVNRWGQPVFEGSGLTPVWDGTINGQAAGEGVYFYRYTITGVTGDELKGHGFLELIR